MKYVIIMTLAAVASAAKLYKVYLPLSIIEPSGASAGLWAPYSSSGFGNSQNQQAGNQNYAQSRSPSAQVKTLRFENENTEDGYFYGYETSDGTKVQQEGRIVPSASSEEGSLQVSGSYSFIGDDGQTYAITYTADENGYHPHGAHLPENVLKRMQLTAAKDAAYNSGKSSHDADNGY